MCLIPLLLDFEEHMADANGCFFSEPHRCPFLKQCPHMHLANWLNRCRAVGAQPKPEAEYKQPTSLEKDGFRIKMNVQNFGPNHISVKLNENTVVIEGKHDERPDEHGSVFRHFIKKYTVPKECDLEKVISTLSSDGILTVKAPFKFPKNVGANERIIEIQQTGPANLTTPIINADDESSTWPSQ